jgi:DNA-binding SARP family transcriptional activator
MQVEQVKQKDMDIPSSCRLRVFLYGPLEVWKREDSGTWKLVDKAAWGKGRAARSVFKRLLAAPGRRLSRGSIQDDLWPESENFELADKTVYNAINQIRRITGKELVRTVETSYEVADQSVIWVDCDACEALLKAAENRGYTSPEALALLERALASFERGELLEGESGTWVYGLRKKSEDMLRQCRLWLAHAYEAHGKLWQAGEQYRALCQQMPPDEEALQRWITMLMRQGKLQDARKCFQDMKRIVEEQGVTLSPAIEQLVASLAEQGQPGHIHPIIPGQDLEEQNMGLSRRNFVQSILGAASTAFCFEDLYPDLETLDRLSKALRPSSELDETTIGRLEMITRDRRYEFVGSEGQTWRELFQEMSGHLRIITQLLERHNNNSHLRTLAGETALLLGDILFNAGENRAADQYYQVALTACGEEGALLRTVILGRQAFIPIYDGHPEKALPLLNEAQQVAPATTADLIVSWLWAITAEAYAHLGNDTECFQALRKAHVLLERGRTGEVTLSFQPKVAPAIFSAARFCNYQGTCNLYLNRSEAAQEALSKQLAYAEKQGQIHHKSIALTDLALSFAQQSAIRQAYKYVTDALNCVEQTRSIRVFQRILNVRQTLNPWENTSYIKNMDAQIRNTALCLARET